MVDKQTCEVGLRPAYESWSKKKSKVVIGRPCVNISWAEINLAMAWHTTVAMYKISAIMT